MKEITFEEEPDMYKHKMYVTYIDNELIGKVRIFDYESKTPELQLVYLTDKGKETFTQSEYFQYFCDFLRVRGYKALKFETEDEELEILKYFEFIDRDTSGWYPKCLYYLNL